MVAKPLEVDPAAHRQQVTNSHLVDAGTERHRGKHLLHRGVKRHDALIDRHTDRESAHTLRGRVDVLPVVATPTVLRHIVTDQ